MDQSDQSAQACSIQIKKYVNGLWKAGIKLLLFVKNGFRREMFHSCNDNDPNNDEDTEIWFQDICTHDIYMEIYEIPNHLVQQLKKFDIESDEDFNEFK